MRKNSKNLKKKLRLKIRKIDLLKRKLKLEKMYKFQKKNCVMQMKLENLSLQYLQAMQIQESQLFVVILCIRLELSISELFRNIKKKLRKREETPGGWLMLWILMMMKKLKEKLLKQEGLHSILYIRELLFSMHQDIKTMFQT